MDKEEINELRELLKLAQFFRDWRYTSDIQKQLEYESNWKKLKKIEEKYGDKK